MGLRLRTRLVLLLLGLFVLAQLPIYIAFYCARHGEQQSFSALENELILIGMLSLAVSALGAMILARSAMRPVVRLTDAVRRVEQGDYLGEVSVHGNDELGDLATAINDMQRGISNREQEIAYQAFHDGLTSLPNRASLQERLERAIERAKDAGQTLAVLMLDIDRFKEINDTMGHAIGDLVLVEMAKRLQANLRVGDTVTRFGGDEFVVLIESVESNDVPRIADSLCHSVTAAVRVQAMDLFLDVSVGVAIYPEHGHFAEDLLRRADIAMYDAKHARCGLKIYETGRDALHLHRLSLVNDLRRAIPHEELVLHYQPKATLGSRHINHVEALLRWQHPRHGLIPPDDFIPLAEQSGIIRQLTKWVMREVIRQCAQWAEQGLDVGVALNLSAMDLGSGDLPDILSNYLAEYGVSPDRLILEVTETAVMRDALYSLGVLNRLKACGVRLAIDDFGTGYSSLSHLKRLPVDELKIDRSFVVSMAHDSDDAVIVRSTIELAHNMGLTVVAEGVEDAHALAMLEGYRCDMVQGYLISRPLPAADIAQWLRMTNAAAEIGQLPEAEKIWV
jgi:diguanylate cyclase (GGDEF)-like protein